jgi:hypothetical protein
MTFFAVAAQNFEYKMSNILDKPTESLFGYISVLVRQPRCTRNAVSESILLSLVLFLRTGTMHYKMTRVDKGR